MKILLTGASGLVGSHVLRHLLVNTEYEVICPVTFRHQGVPERIASALKDQDSGRVLVERLDLRAGIAYLTRKRWGQVDVIMNVASESHVDRSIDYPADFINNNVEMMLGILEYARRVKPSLFLHMSTDEVYGPAPAGYAHREGEPHRPSNPYSASKAAQEAIAFSYWRTYGLPIVVSNTMNIVGEGQDVEKYVPKVMRCIANGETVPVHVDTDGTPGSRFYLHARNLADAWLFLTERYVTKPDGTVGAYVIPQYEYGYTDLDRWNIVGEREVSNLEMAQMIAGFMGKELKWEPVQFHHSRPGHDLRYALDGSKLAAAGWKAPFSLEDSLRKTVEWTMQRPEWLA